ncbi:hypothetical protein ACFXA0_17005 [Streptomyces cyaneofuscatus]
MPAVGRRLHRTAGGTVVTADAMRTRCEPVRRIVAAGGHSYSS